MELCLVVIICFSLNFVSAGEYKGTKCRKEPMFGDHSFNLYYCKESGKPRCCLVEKKFACCEPGAIKELRRQLQIWGTIGGVMFLTISVYIWYKYDFSFCEKHKTLREQYQAFCCCICNTFRRRKYGAEDDQMSMSISSDSSLFRQSPSSDICQVQLQDLDIPSKMQPSYSGHDGWGRKG